MFLFLQKRFDFRFPKPPDFILCKQIAGGGLNFFFYLRLKGFGDIFLISVQKLLDGSPDFGDDVGRLCEAHDHVTEFIGEFFRIQQFCFDLLSEFIADFIEFQKTTSFGRGQRPLGFA